MLDVAEPSSKLSLEAYAQMARDELASLAASEDALPVLVGGTGVYIQSVLDGWDLSGMGPLRRSLERDFPRSDVKGAYQMLARLAPEVARRVHPSNYEAILNALVRRMAGQAGNEAFRANSTPVRSTALMTLRDSRHGSGVWPPATDGVLHAYVLGCLRKGLKPGGRPGVARHEIALPLTSDPCTDRWADNRCNGRTLDADGESAVAHNLD